VKEKEIADVIPDTSDYDDQHGIKPGCLIISQILGETGLLVQECCGWLYDADIDQEDEIEKDVI
jgi:hypothetical protein